MRKKISTTITLTLLLSLLLPFFINGSISAETTGVQTIDYPTKSWTISFNDAVASDEQNRQKIYVTTANKEIFEVSINLSADSKKVIVEPKNPYIFGTTYTLVIPQDFQSANGSKLNAEVTKQFQLKGKVISKISTNMTPLLTNVIVNGSNNIMKVTVSINGDKATSLNYVGTHFSKGFIGLIKGDTLTINAYDQNNNLLETQKYVVK